jgi:hypothetical protein
VVFWIAAEVQQGIVEAAGTIVAALIVGVAGALIGRRYTRERDRQDKESQWRDHAIELTKLDLERKLRTWSPESLQQVRPSIQDFLANYRDLKELDTLTPAELYEKIEKSRIQDRQQGPTGSPPTATSPPGSGSTRT